MTGRPEVLVSRAAAAILFDEVRRWVEAGLREQGTALESLLYPLSALVPRQGLVCPLELVHADQIHQLVVDQAAIPPDSVKSFSAHNCHFSAADMAAANRDFNAEIDRLLDRRPRLAVLSKLHAHPFVGGAFLSGGDLYHGVSSPAAVAWRLRRGLATAILHVAHPDDEPALSAAPWRVDAQGAICRGAGGRRVRWRVRSWALDRGGAMQDLGDARVVSTRHPSIRAARRKPYWRTRRGARWCDAQKAALRAAGYRVSRNLLGRGWRRYLLELRGGHVVLGLPPDLPAARPRVLWVHDAAANAFEVLRLPGRLLDGASLTALALEPIARHLGAPPARA